MVKNSLYGEDSKRSVFALYYASSATKPEEVHNVLHWKTQPRP